MDVGGKSPDDIPQVVSDSDTRDRLGFSKKPTILELGEITHFKCHLVARLTCCKSDENAGAGEQ